MNGFCRSGQIESWGRGLEKINNYSIADGLPKPEINVSQTVYRVCFSFPENYVSINHDNATINEDSVTINQKNATINQENATINQENATINQDNATINQENTTINNRQFKLLQLIKENPKITIKEIKTIIPIDESNIKRNLKKLIALGIIQRVGARKNGYWQIIKQIKEDFENNG